MSKKRSIRYNQEFKDNAVNLIKTSGKSLSRISKDLDVAVSTLIKWRDQAQSNELTSEDAESNQLKKDYLALKKEHARLQEENAILKKASAYFAQQMK